MSPAPRRRALALLIAATAWAVGCATERRPDPRALRAAIETEEGRFMEAFSHRDAAAIAQIYSADAQAFPPGSAPVVGRPAIQEMWKGVLSMPVGRIQLTAMDLDGNSETVWETGRYTIMGTNGSTMDEGKFIQIWKRDESGWRLYRDMWNSSSPPQAPAPEEPAAEQPAKP